MILWSGLPAWTALQEHLWGCREDEAKIHGVIFFFLMCKIGQNLSHCSVGGKAESGHLFYNERDSDKS